MHLNYKKTGDGPPIIILHGVLGSLDNWQTQARMLGEHYTVYTVDQRNHGQSPHDDEMSYDLMAEDLKAFMEEHHIENSVLMGHSMGGKTVMRFALEYAYMIRSLIVVDISPRSYPVHHDQILNALARVNFDELRSRKEVEDYLMRELKDRGVVFFLTKNVYWESNDRLGYRFNLEAIRRTIGEISDWPEIHATYERHCLFIRGGKSAYIRDDDRELFRYFPHATLHTIPDAGHWVHADQPQAFYEAVFQYLQSLRD